jgi:uncharacterized membrane protein YkgB
LVFFVIELLKLLVLVCPVDGQLALQGGLLQKELFVDCLSFFVFLEHVGKFTEADLEGGSFGFEASLEVVVVLEDLHEEVAVAEFGEEVF